MRAPFPILILGGTTEAMQLAALLKDSSKFAPVMSLAGRTAQPRLPEMAHRSGGFGGVDGLKRYLRENAVAAVVDATHPFAARMSGNAARACADLNVPLAVLTRPAWERCDGDRWIEVDDFAAARDALGTAPRTVLLTIGRQEVGAFRGGVGHRYVVRSVDAVAPELLPDGARVIAARGPFDEDQEIALMQREGIDAVVSKNAGGGATYAKIAAARRLALPVIMIRRPRSASDGEMHDAAAVMRWLEACCGDHAGTS